MHDDDETVGALNHDNRHDRETEHRWHALTIEERRAIKHLLTRQHRPTNPNVLLDHQLTAGQRIADGVARVMGSWKFIILQSVILIGWICLNVLGWINHWDPYPFILLNLALSFQAAYSAPIIMMSQNRQAAKDRLTAELDYQVNLHAELEVSGIRTLLDDLSGKQWDQLVQLQHEQIQMLTRIEQLTAEVHRLTTTGRPST